MQVVKARSGHRLTAVHSTVVYGDPDEVRSQVGGHTAPDRNERGERRWQRQTPAMEAGLTDHRWTIKELLSTVVAPEQLNT